MNWIPCPAEQFVQKRGKHGFHRAVVCRKFAIDRKRRRIGLYYSWNDFLTRVGWSSGVRIEPFKHTQVFLSSESTSSICHWPLWPSISLKVIAPFFLWKKEDTRSTGNAGPTCASDDILASTLISPECLADPWCGGGKHGSLGGDEGGLLQPQDMQGDQVWPRLTLSFLPWLVPLLVA